MQRHSIHQYVAEFIGTFFLVFMSCGAIVIHQYSADMMNPMAIPLIFGATIAVMIYAVGHISGAHFNPAVSLAFCVARKFPVYRLIPYVIAQCLGAIAASGLHKLIFPHVHDFGRTAMTLNLPGGIIIEVVLSFLLMFVIISVATDTRAVGELAGIAIGTTVGICAFVGGPLTGASMNPARSLGPAIWAGDFQNLWIYMLFPCVGTIIGAVVYERIRCYKEDVDSQHGCC